MAYYTRSSTTAAKCPEKMLLNQTIKFCEDLVRWYIVESRRLPNQVVHDLSKENCTLHKQGSRVRKFDVMPIYKYTINLVFYRQTTKWNNTNANKAATFCKSVVKNNTKQNKKKQTWEITRKHVAVLSGKLLCYNMGVSTLWAHCTYWGDNHERRRLCKHTKHHHWA